MRSLLNCVVLLIGLNLCAKGKPTLTVDTTGRAVVCFNKDSLWSVRLEQFRWNRWVTVLQLDLAKKADTCIYVLVDIHSGENIFRLRGMHNGEPTYVCTESRCTSAVSITNEAVGSEYHSSDTIPLPRISMWELYDGNGKIVLKGYSSQVFLDGMEPGEYYFAFDNNFIMIAILPEEKGK